MLKRDPCHAEALVGMSLVALASRQSQAAVQMATAAVTVAPTMDTAWVALGQALRTVDRCDDAEQAYEQAIRLDGTSPLARMGLAELKIATERPAEAIADYELALRRRPSLVPAHLGRGHALMCLERYEEALESYERALAFSPRLAEADFAAGFVLARMGRPQEAERRYRHAIARRPDFAAAWLNLGCLLREQGSDVAAQAALERSAHLRPDLTAVWINLAILARERRRPREAEAHLRRALALDPGEVETHIAWCQFRNAEKDAAGAWGWLHWALARDAHHAEAQNMRGILLHNEGRFVEAVEVFMQAERLGSRAATSNRGNSLLDMGRVEEALAVHETAAARDPHNAGARYNLALTQLRMGQWKRGWPAYEARWTFREVHRRPRVFRQPRWGGEALAGRRILLHAEQGLGDTIQFCRYAALVAARGGRPILQVQAPVERLVRSLPLVRAGQAEVAVLGIDPPAFDLECPLMSLPAAFGTTVDTVPWTGAYLAAESSDAGRRRAQFPSVRQASPSGREAGLRVGLAWAGNPRYKADCRRSMQLSTLLPLLRTAGVTWISLQKGDAAGQIAVLPDCVLIYDGSSRDGDLAETASLLATLDLVITTDTCIAHLAGAMGKPVWILLPHLADWRWMQDRETTPWYPTARLLRQSAPGAWGELVNRVTRQLGDLRPNR